MARNMENGGRTEESSKMCKLSIPARLICSCVRFRVLASSECERYSHRNFFSRIHTPTIHRFIRRISLHVRLRVPLLRRQDPPELRRGRPVRVWSMRPEMWYIELAWFKYSFAESQPFWPVYAQQESSHIL